MTKIKLGIVGYGNLGRGVEAAVRQNSDFSLEAVFTRRDPAKLALRTPNVPVLHVDSLAQQANGLDVLLLCGGSATDLPQTTPKLATLCNVVDSFDTHAHIPQHFAAVENAAAQSGHLALISAGWDPGLFSLMRAYARAVLPQGQDYTFWGRGVSQGHSDAIRRIPGVVDARQYTVPVPAAIEAVRSGATPALTTRQKHTRECFVVAAEGADRAEIARQIQTMPRYFAEYDTTVTFVDAETLQNEHGGLPHGGFVLRNGQTAGGYAHRMEFALQLESNPEFTASVLLCYARAVARLAAQGKTGCITVLDVAPALLLPQSGAQLREELL